MRVLVIANNGDVFAVDNADIMVTPSRHIVTGKDEIIIHGDADVFTSRKHPEVFLQWLKDGYGNNETSKITRPTNQEKINELSDDEVKYISNDSVVTWLESWCDDAINYHLNDPSVIGGMIQLIRHELQPYEPLIEFLDIEVFPDKFMIYLRVGDEHRRVARPWPFNEGIVDEIIESVVKDDESGETGVRDQPNE